MVVAKKDLKKNITLYTYIRLYWAGFGKTTIFRIIALLGLPIGTKYHNINLRSRAKLRSILRSFTKNLMDANTERAVQIRRLVKLRLIRGFRLRRSLPVRGQGTHTNAKTRRHRNVK